MSEKKSGKEIVDQGPATYLMLDEISVTLAELLKKVGGECHSPDAEFSAEKKEEEKKDNLIAKISDLESNMTDLNNKLDDVVSMMKKERTPINLFDTGLVTLPNAVATVPDVLNTNPVTGYTIVEFENNMHRLSGVLNFIVLGPGPVYMRYSHDRTYFSDNEVATFAGQRKQFDKVSLLLVRTDIAGTRFIATEHPTDLIINNFDDRVATPAHIFFGLDTFAPHGSTVRASYTVPTGFKAKINGCYVFIEIESPAAVPARRNVTVVIQSPGIGGLSVMSRTFGQDQNADGAVKEGELGFAYTLLTGEQIQLVTQDNSTGGFVSYFASAEVTQYFSFPT